MVILTSKFIYNRSQQLKMYVCIWTQRKVIIVIHLWKVLKRLYRNALHDLESNIDFHHKNALQVVLSAILSWEADEAERIAGLIIDEYLTIL